MDSIETEKAIIKWQYGAFVIAVIIFISFGFISRSILHTTIRYAALTTILPMFYVAISSIKNRVSILRLKGQKEYSKDKQAVMFGAILLVVEIATFIFLLTPFSTKYVNF